MVLRRLQGAQGRQVPRRCSIEPTVGTSSVPTRGARCCASFTGTAAGKGGVSGASKAGGCWGGGGGGMALGERPWRSVTPATPTAARKSSRPSPLMVRGQLQGTTTSSAWLSNLGAHPAAYRHVMATARCHGITRPGDALLANLLPGAECKSLSSKKPRRLKCRPYRGLSGAERPSREGGRPVESMHFVLETMQKPRRTPHFEPFFAPSPPRSVSKKVLRTLTGEGYSICGKPGITFMGLSASQGAAMAPKGAASSMKCHGKCLQKRPKTLVSQPLSAATIGRYAYAYGVLDDGLLQGLQKHICSYTEFWAMVFYKAVFFLSFRSFFLLEHSNF